MLLPIWVYTIISRLTRAGHFLITTLSSGWGKAWQSHHCTSMEMLPPSSQSVPAAAAEDVLSNLLNSHFSVDVDHSLSHLCPRCPVKLHGKNLYLLKAHTINLLLGLCPVHSLHSIVRAKILGREGCKRARLLNAKDLLQVMEQRRP